MDLQPGWRLRIIVPLLKSGGFRASDLSSGISDGTPSLSSEDVIGYRVFEYAIDGKKDGRVHLKFISGEARNGTKAVEPHPPALPFTLPTQTEHIRLVYLVRVSEADHNMAIVASRHRQDLDQFTKQLQKNPNVCATGGAVFCVWIPGGVAVRPEHNESTS